MNTKKSVVPGLSVIASGLLLALMSVVFLAQSGFCASWTTETVDAEDKDFTDFYQRAIAIDGFDHPHIAYGGNHLYYAHFSGIEWQYETVDNSQQVGGYASIAIDSNNKVHISYHDNTNYDLKYATDVSGSWVTSTIDSGGWVGYYTSIAIDSNNNVHISYYASLSYNLKYATDVSGSWVTSTIDSGYVDGRTSIAIDSNNNVHISYCDRTDYGGYFKYYLNFATDVSGSWVTSTIDSEDNVGWDNSIAIDSNDNVHVSYHDSANGDLKYVTDVSGAWVTSTIDNRGRCTSIAIDSNNNVHISYYDSANGALKYATNSLSYLTPDISSPTISSTTPGNDATDVATNTSITATFSEAMDSSTITADTFLVNDGTINIAGTVTTVTQSDTVATFSPTTALDYSTTYTATITTGAKDLAGNALEADYTWSFTTESETPTDGEPPSDGGGGGGCFISVM